VVTVIGVVSPVIVGTAGVVPEAFGTITRSDRHTPSPGTTLEESAQLAATQLPVSNTWLALEHARQLLGPLPEQLEQLASHDWHVEDVLSKNWDWLHVGKHLPFVSTGRSEGHDEHWLNDAPEQVAQSGWQERHEPEELNVFEGQLATHDPSEASWLLAQVRQKVDEPAQVEHEESQDVHVKLFVGETNVSEGQLSTHWPCERTNPGRHPVHCS